MSTQYYSLCCSHPELTKVCEKEMKILLSSFSVLLWDSINQLPLYEHSTSWPTELIEVLLAYLNMRKEQLRSTQVRMYILGIMYTMRIDSIMSYDLHSYLYCVTMYSHYRLE